jgi:sugar/nucleoside kinase (ribokinase family)
VESPDYLVIGHLAKDLVGASYRLGGTVAYAALTARNLGRRVAVVTRAGPDLEVDDCFRDIQLLYLPSPESTTFLNVYTAGQREQYVRAVAETIPTNSIPSAWRHTPIVHLGPIVHEFGEEMISLFPVSLLGLTPQGWLRRWDEQGRVSPRRWSVRTEDLRRIDVLVVSEEDMAGEAGALRSQLNLPRLAVVTQGARGAVLYHGGQMLHFPARRTEVADVTGAGDVFAAAFLVRLAETEDPIESSRFAGAASSLSVQKAGISSAPRRAQIERLLAAEP